MSVFVGGGVLYETVLILVLMYVRMEFLMAEMMSGQNLFWVFYLYGLF